MRVVAAVLEDASGRVLLAQRPAGKTHAGLWEFPGGKIEPGESAPDALNRELREELGIEVASAVRFMTVRRPHVSGELVLEAWRSDQWHGEPAALEHSALRWCAPGEALSLPLCDADIPICRAAAMPGHYAITPDPGTDDVAAGFLARIEAGLRRGIRLVQWRAPTLDAARYREIALALRQITANFDARLLLNATPELAFELGADGVHLNASRLMLTPRFPRPDDFLVAASVHDRRELAQAAAIGADFVVISPIRPTASHALVDPIGWHGFHALREASDVSAYALGGVSPRDLGEARARGALGVAGISAFW